MKDFLWRFCIPFPEKEKKNEMNCTLKQNQFTSRKHICPKRCVHIPLPRALTPSSPLSFPVASGGEHKSDNQHWGSRGLRWLWTRFDWPSGMLSSLHIWPYSSLALAVYDCLIPIKKTLGIYCGFLVFCLHGIFSYRASIFAYVMNYFIFITNFLHSLFQFRQNMIYADDCCSKWWLNFCSQDHKIWRVQTVSQTSILFWKVTRFILWEDRVEVDWCSRHQSSSKIILPDGYAYAPLILMHHRPRGSLWCASPNGYISGLELKALHKSMKQNKIFFRLHCHILDNLMMQMAVCLALIVIKYVKM